MPVRIQKYKATIWLPTMTMALVTTCACGTAASGVDDGSSSNASKPRCDPEAAFGKPVPLTEVNTGPSQEDGYLSPDELTMYFSSLSADDAYDVFMATRLTRTSPWANIQPVAGVNTPRTERRPVVTADGLTMYASIVPPIPSTNFDIGVATRPDPTAAFTAIAPVANINGGENDEASTIVNGKSLWMSSTRTGNGDLYRADKIGDQFAEPVPVPGIAINDPSGSDLSPVVTPDELTLFFGSSRAGGLGAYDVWTAKRTSVTSGFDAPVNLGAVNTGHYDVPSWVSADGCVLYLTTGIIGAFNIEVATRGM